MFCPKCGNSVTEEFNFCFNCGFNLSSLKNINDTQSQDLDNTTDSSIRNNTTSHNIQHSTSNLNTPKEININNYFKSIFTGSQESYEALICKFLYQDKNFEKASDFESFIEDNYPNNNFYCKYSPFTAIWLLDIGLEANNNGILKAITNSVDKEELEDIGISKTISTFLIACFWYNVFGTKDFNVNLFLYEWNKNIDKYNSLYDQNNKSYSEHLQSKMNEIKSLYNNDISTENFRKLYIEKIDLKHIMPHINKYASQNATIVTDTYCKILDNAIKYHHANYLKNMYPTTEQKNKVANLIENEILNQFRKASNNLHIVIQKGDECLRLINNINDLKDKSSDSSLLKKGALTLGLTLISGPLGLMNAAREGYNLFEANDKVNKLRETLDTEFSNYIDEYSSYLDDNFKCLDTLKHSLNENILDKYLQPAINQIFSNLKNNNAVILPLRDYLL